MQQDNRSTRLRHTGFEGVLSKSRSRLRELGSKLAARLEPVPVVRRGAQLAVHALFLLVSGLLGLGLASPWGVAANVLVGIVIGVLLLGLVNLIVSGRRAFLPYLPRYLGRGTITIILAFYVLLVLLVRPAATSGSPAYSRRCFRCRRARRSRCVPLGHAPANEVGGSGRAAR